ncbi:DedA family protein [Sporosarcina cyprini]|uniref:DedA family protein n=1 Tax=Sporosarcina cyprini TaxID=2910523 RepID=UPI001EE05B79|nr:DedA family protein [Sporosarcina cyprini]MCG3089349.1 DedA family protein [Sporosarcina cyprini]
MLQFQDFFIQYGYYAIFIFLALGIFGLPLPDEVVVAFVGHLSSLGTFNYPVAMVVTMLGVMSGTLVTFAFGRKIGKPLLDKYGKWISLSPKRLQLVNRWFDRYGSWAVTIGYFVPGMRHVICYMSGSSGMDFRRYILFASIGTAISSILCLTIGYLIKLPF